MQIKQIKAEGLSKQYEVTIPAKDFDSAYEAQLSQISGQIRLPGFRPGKVPVRLVRQRHGEAVRGEVLEKKVRQAMEKLLADEKLRPAAQPGVDLQEHGEGKDVKFTVSVEELPEFPEIDYSKITLEKAILTVPEAEVNEAMERLAARNKQWQAPAKRKTAQSGDTVVIDFKGSVDGTPFEGGTAEKFRLELGSGQFIPGFEAQLEGKKLGEDVNVNVTFPQTYHAENLAGKDAVFAVKIHEILEAKPVAIDEEFAKTLGFEKLDELKEAVAKQINSEYEELVDNRLKKQLFDALEAELKSVPLPAGLVEQEFNAIWGQLQQAKAQGDPSLDKPEDELRSEYRAISERRVKLGLLLAEIGQKENVQVSQQDLSKAVWQQARNYPGQEQKVLEFYQKNPDQLTNLRGPVIEEKVVALLLGKVKLEEKPTTPEALMAEEEGENTASESKKKPAAKKAKTTGEKEAAEKPAEKKTAAKKATAKSDDAKPAAKKSTAKKPATKKAEK